MYLFELKFPLGVCLGMGLQDLWYCTSVHSDQECGMVPFFPHPFQDLLVIYLLKMCLFIYLCCAGSLTLCTGFLQLQQAGATF